MTVNKHQSWEDTCRGGPRFFCWRDGECGSTSLYGAFSTWGPGATPLVRGPGWLRPPEADDIFALEGEFKQWKLHPFQHHLCNYYCHKLCRNTTYSQTWWQWWACHLSIVLLTLMHAVFNMKYMLTLWSRFNFYYSHISNVSLSTLQTEINYFKFHF